MRARPPFARIAAVGIAAAALLHSSCGDSAPSSSTPPTTIARPSPTPSVPSGGDPFHDASCTFGPGDPDAECARNRAGSGDLLNEYEDAIDLLAQQKPNIFDMKDQSAPDTRTYKVLDKDAYLDGLVRNLRAAHLCAERDPDDGEQQTIRIKNASDFSEDYDTLTSDMHARRGNGAYRQSCTPSAFPVNREENAPPIGSGCGRPYPPEVTRFNCKVHIKAPDRYTLDSTPLVGPDPVYCAAIGYTDGRTICPVRPEGTADREACENWRVGHARDTGRPGPTWTKADGSFCTGPASGCENHPSTQYSLFTYVPGTYIVTAENGAECTVSH
jgi:hypothetical protein